MQILEMNGDSYRLKQSKSCHKVQEPLGEKTLATEIADPDTGEITAV